MESIKEFIQNEVISLSFKKVSFNESIIKSKILDSIAVVDLLVAIEERIGKKFPQYLINDDNFDTIEKIVVTINKI